MAELTGRAVSELVAASSLGDADLFALSQGGSSKKLSGAVLKASVLAGAIKTNLASQTISSTGAVTELSVSNTTNNALVKITANAEGGNLRLEKGLAHCELDTNPMNNSGTGNVRFYLNDGSSTEVTKQFLFRQDGSFVDGNGVNTGTMWSNLQAVSTFAYNNTIATFTEDISGTNTRLFTKNKDVIINYQGENKTHATGDTLFTLKPGYRPSYLFYVPFVCNNTGYGTLSVNTDGAVKVSAIANGSTAGRIYAQFSFPTA